MQKRFDDRVVLVTGASQGVGAACVKRFAAEGARLVLAARREAPLTELATSLSGVEVAVVPTDVSSTSGCRALIEQTVETFGCLDVLVNNAGAHFRGPALERTEEELATMVDVNTRGPIVLTRLALPHLMKSGGVVVNVASIAGKVPLPDAATYSASKFALRAFSLALAQELKDHPVDICLVNPGPIIDTGFLMDSLEDAADVVFSQPMSTADQIAAMVVESAHDRRSERSRPASSAWMASLSYMFPGVRRVLEPVLVRRGRVAKARYLQERAATKPQKK